MPRACAGSCRGCSEVREPPMLAPRQFLIRGNSMKPFRSAVAALALFVSAPALAQALTAEESQQIDALVTTTLADTGVPSASVAIVRGGKIVFPRAWGKPSPELAPARADVPPPSASIPNNFQAT